MNGHSGKKAGVAPIGDVLSKTLDNLGLFPKAKKYQVFSVWARIVGDIARHATPRRLSGDVLFVATASSAWAQELTFMRQSILDKIKDALGGDYVREIRFSEHLWDPSEDSPSLEGDLFPFMVRGDQARLMDGIPDARLASTAKRFSITMGRRRQFLIRQGYKVCGTCGCLYPSRKAECPFCKAKQELLSHNRAIAILDRAPFLGDEEILALIGSGDKDLVQRARRDLESRCLTVARNGLAREARKAADDVEIAQVIGKLASLRSGKPVEEISREELEKAVGRRFALAARKGSLWRRGSMSGLTT